MHFDRSHTALIASLTALLRKGPVARTYVSAGKYTRAHVCESFVRDAERAGIVLVERDVDEGWRGALDVRGEGLDMEGLAARKNNCRWWVGRWRDGENGDA